LRQLCARVVKVHFDNEVVEGGIECRQVRYCD
jgi:hypothetical protein